MPDRSGEDYLLFKNRSASGGVNTFSSELDIREDQIVDLTNGLASVPGIRGVRSGSSIVATGVTWGPVKAISEFTPGSYTTELLIVTPGATYPDSAHLRLWKWDGTGGQFTLLGTLSGYTSATLPVDIITGLDLNAPGGPAIARISTKQPLDFEYIYNGSIVTSVSGGNARPSTGAFPMGTALGRAFVAGRVGSSRAKIFYSDVASWAATGWASSQSFTMGGGTRQEIVALKEFRQGDLVVFLKDRIEVLQLDGDPYGVQNGEMTSGAWSRGVIDRRIGCASSNSVQTSGEDLLFADQYGNVRSLNRTITDNSQGVKRLPISAPLQSWVDRINPAAIESIEAVSYDRYYIVSYPIDNSTTPSHTFVYDTINDSWSGPWDGPWASVGKMTVATLSSATAASDKNPTVFIGASSTGNAQIYRAFVGTGDNGSSIVFQEKTKRISFDTLDAKKRPRRIRLYSLPSAGATMMIEGRADGGTFKLVGYADLSGASPQLPLTLPVDLTGQGIVEVVKTLESNFENARDLQFRFTCTAPVEVRLLGYTVQVHMQNVDWTPT